MMLSVKAESKKKVCQSWRHAPIELDDSGICPVCSVAERFVRLATGQAAPEDDPQLKQVELPL